MRLSTLFGLVFPLISLTIPPLPLIRAREQQCRLKPSNGAQTAFSSSPHNQPPKPGGGTGTGPPGSTASNTSTGQPNGNSGASPQPENGMPFDYSSQKIRGVNLGGWLVLEPWITPGLFDDTGNDNIIDEFTLGSMMDRGKAMDMLYQHWETWITEADFVDIKNAGLNHVRIPLGYWSVPLNSSWTNTSTSVDPYIPGAWPYLLRALTWAKNQQLHVIIDIHGAPGSQNGYDNSGQRTGNPTWATDAENVQRTLDTVRFIVANVGEGMLDMIELLNEGAGFKGQPWGDVIKQYFLDGYGVVREEVGNGVQVMIGDAFMGVMNWDGFLTYPSAVGVLMDYHQYQIFSDLELSRSLDEHISFACTNLASLHTYASQNIWTVIGEWSNAPTDCTKWLNGRGVGSRWDNTWNPGGGQYHGSCQGWTGDMAGFSDDYKQFLRKYWEVQIEMGETISGWIFWTWKAENSDEWSYSKGLEGGWIPQDPTQRLYPNICS